ncbi:hypothetical protein [Actinoplanes sp. NBRC 101535]|uniref:hypothetical protein n=1 Tax=Actinoplanes sp. NBRC 101535 TaxID=3032196 RepID=UPI0024A1ACC1|nr:hypothetical protein [Actinoplanes sp. NBRC 101535]GLY06515.1 hypothetical protein Acsp01_68940 [Actinoplanes sp. NBRC 101535]
MTTTAGFLTALTVAGTAALVPAGTAQAATTAQATTTHAGTTTHSVGTTAHSAGPCAPTQPGTGFYAAGRVASAPVTVPASRCTTIAVSHIRDAADPDDTCQTFLLAFLSPTGGDPTYTEPVEACSPTPGRRTVLASGVPDGTVFRVLYQVDYIDPAIQTVKYTAWR